nr:unnamed protein product [Digitaria exilis]
MSALSVLDLALNQLEGTIPHSLVSISGLPQLTLANNSLRAGEPPESLYNFFTERVTDNIFHGAISVDIGSRFPSMEVLFFRDNQFNGSIPMSASNLTKAMSNGERYRWL